MLSLVPRAMIPAWVSRRYNLEASASHRTGYPWDRNPQYARDASAEAVLQAFASMPVELALEHLQTTQDGLFENEANLRRKIKGQNVLPSHKPPSWFLLLLGAIPNPFNVLLFFLAIINVALPDRDWAGFSVLMGMVVISVVVRFWQEYRSGVAVFKLQSTVSTNTKVRRSNANPEAVAGKTSLSTDVAISEKDLVPGDIMILSPGAVVPADCLILQASFLRISQSTWTGENGPVAKTVASDGEKDTPLFDLANIAFMGSSVVSGNGLALILRTGGDVLIAVMANELTKRRETNSFQRGIRNVSWMLIGFMFVMVPIVLCINAKTTGNWKNAALFSISVAVGLVPEMLPAIVNANLARGAHVLSKKKAIAKRLDSVQNLGAMSILCSDKTGTLTKDEIVLQRFLDSAGNDSGEVLKLATVDANVQGTNGNNIDQAIAGFRFPNGEAVSIASYTKVAAIPFNFERRRSACIVRGATGQHLLICKGAFDEVLSLCTNVRRGGVVSPLDIKARRSLVAQAGSMNAKGHRVLLVAMKQLNTVNLEDEDGMEALESRMTLEGMLTFVDPPKDDAAAAISSLKGLGVEVKVLTGDNLAVALNVCQTLKLIGTSDFMDSDDIQAITGPDLALLEGTPEFDTVVKTCTVFAKLTPTQKALVVASLRKAGHCVGMLGDGINDCVALRRADVGISVDSGAGAAKDCADLILTEKGLDIIVDSVRVGRITHGNTIKYIKMVASSNFGNVFSILAASAWLPFTPMTSLQILCQNLLYDISQIAIPWDRIDEEYLLRPKRWNSLDLLKFTLVLGPTSSVIDICTFCLGWFYYGIRTTADPLAVRQFQSHWFLQGLLTQTLIVHLLRTAKVPFIQSRAALPLACSTVAIMTIGFVLPWIPPFQKAFLFVNPAGSYIGFLFAELLLYCIEVQVVKMIYMRIFNTWL